MGFHGVNITCYSVIPVLNSPSIQDAECRPCCTDEVYTKTESNLVDKDRVPFSEAFSCLFGGMVEIRPAEAFDFSPKGEISFIWVLN